MPAWRERGCTQEYGGTKITLEKELTAPYATSGCVYATGCLPLRASGVTHGRGAVASVSPSAPAHKKCPGAGLPGHSKEDVRRVAADLFTFTSTHGDFVTKLTAVVIFFHVIRKKYRHFTFNDAMAAPMIAFERSACRNTA